MKTNSKQSKAPKLSPEELEENTVLLTHGGSIMYGLNHADSDEDFYRVVPDELYWLAIGSYPRGNPHNLALHTIIDGVDQTLVSEKTFHKFCFEGIPQALEAMFAPLTLIDKIESFRNDYFAGLNLDHMCGKYTRTIKSFAYGNTKKRQHALRLSFNLAEAMETGGRFNPKLSEEQVAFVRAKARSTPDEFIHAIQEINYFTIDDDWNWDELNQNFSSM